MFAIFLCVWTVVAGAQTSENPTTDSLDSDIVDPIPDQGPDTKETSASASPLIFHRSSANFTLGETSHRTPDDDSPNWPLYVVTWVIAVLAAYIAYFHVDQSTRPTLTILIDNDGSCAKSTQPTVENTSKTDAEGTVILKLLIDGISYDCDREGTGAYSGRRIWYFPATNKCLRGNIDLGERIEEICQVSDLSKNCIFLESCMHYRRYYPHGKRRRKWVFLRFYYKTYSSPIQRWKLDVIQKRWVLVPDFSAPQIPYPFDWKILR
jgi:hypothetical protein